MKFNLKSVSEVLSRLSETGTEQTLKFSVPINAIAKLGIAGEVIPEFNDAHDVPDALGDDDILKVSVTVKSVKSDAKATASTLTDGEGVRYIMSGERTRQIEGKVEDRVNAPLPAPSGNGQ